MNAHSLQDRNGFTLIELLVVIALLGTLLGLILPAVQQVRVPAQHLRQDPQLAQLSLDVEALLDQYEADARRFFLELGAIDPSGNPDAVNIDSLLSFCDADEVAQRVREHVAQMLLNRNLPAVSRRLLTDLLRTIDGALLPAVMKMSGLLHERAQGFCGPRIP